MLKTRENIEQGTLVTGRPFVGSGMWNTQGVEATGEFVGWDADGDAIVRHQGGEDFLHGHSVEIA